MKPYCTQNNTVRVLMHNNIIEEFDRGSVGIWMDYNDVEWELFFDEGGDFRGVVLDNLTPEQRAAVERDCENSEGFYNSLFSNTDISEYDLKYDIAE